MPVNDCDVKTECQQQIRDRLLIEDEAELTIKCGTTPDKCSRAVRLRKKKKGESKP